MYPLFVCMFVCLSHLATSYKRFDGYFFSQRTLFKGDYVNDQRLSIRQCVRVCVCHTLPISLSVTLLVRDIQS